MQRLRFQIVCMPLQADTQADANADACAYYAHADACAYYAHADAQVDVGDAEACAVALHLLNINRQ